MSRKMKKIGLLIVLLLIASAVSACRRTPDEERARQAIAAVVQAAESGSASDVSKFLTQDFDGNAGELDTRSLVGMLTIIRLRGDHVGVAMGPVSIDKRGERIVASFTVTLSSGGKLLPEQMGLYQVESGWRGDHGKWLCYTASWRRSL